MLYIRCVELFTECIPSTLIQGISFLSRRSPVAAISLFLSVMTSAFIAASVSIEKDVSEKSRQQDPTFYGWVPLGSMFRTCVVCLLVFLFSACQLTLKVFALALCSLESPKIISLYLLIEIGSLLALKIVRNDLLFYWPIRNKIAWCAASLIIHTACKCLLDFTGLLVLRQPEKLGGAYFTSVLLYSPLVCFYFGYRYLTYVSTPDVSTPDSFSANIVYGVIGSLTAIQVASILLFLSIIDRKYWKSFTSFETGRQAVCRRFLECTQPDEDGIRLKVFKTHQDYWKPIEPSVRLWLNSRLTTWYKETPEFWNPATKAMIPDDLVDDLDLLKRIQTERKQKKKKKKKNENVK
ncbi:hypothetical protein TrVE_jg8879 [Triparma verrucosa]|uniref:Uncharacterized protein n=1 Tax=Triparma verrucosa TaxID=1606542 RepID=A0A9W7C2J6_9STRA|nr:hypothetical protein TrVE_jg8879 [Triparma verrucosa]